MTWPHQVISGNDQNMSPTNQKTAGSKARTNKLADVLWLSEASEKLFRQLFGVNRLTGMSSHTPSEKVCI